jgi:hypothetical protein
MNTQELIKNIYRKCQGEYDETITPDSPDGATILSIINEQIDYYYSCTDEYGYPIVWNHNIDPEYVIGTVQEGATTYEIDWNEVTALPSGFGAPVRIGDNNTRYDLVPFNELYHTRNDRDKVCAISNLGLTFKTPPSDYEDEGDIKLPCMVRGSYLNGSERSVRESSGVHNELWLEWAAAAEYTRTDMVRGAQYPNVFAQADAVFKKMVKDNENRSTPQTYAWFSDVVDVPYGSYVF